MNYAQFKYYLDKQSCLKKSCINLVASENIPSATMLSVLNSDLDNRYPLSDFPNNSFLRRIQEDLEEGLCTLFASKYVDCSPLSGMNCMELIFASLANANDNVYIIPPISGGHASTARNGEAFGYRIHYLPITAKTQQLDEDKLEKMFHENPPKLVYLDNTLICFFRDPTSLVNLAHRYNALIVYDASQVLGLIAGNVFPNPLEYGVDCLCGSTHKTFPGPQKAIILSNNCTLMQRIKKVAVDFISSIHSNSIMALYIATLEMLKFGEAYASQIVANSKALGEHLYSRGISVPTYAHGITETHQVWIQVDNPQLAYEKMAQFGINTNCMRIPAIESIGLRLGTAEVTRLGMKEGEMKIIADCIADILLNRASNSVKTRINNLTRLFNRVCYSLEDEQLSLMQNSQHYSFHRAPTVDFDAAIADFEEQSFHNLPHYCGMIIRGGVGRGTADIYSDIDFTCILDVEDAELYRKKNGLLRGMFRYKGVMFSARYMTMKEFTDGIWSDKMKHAYQFSIPVHCTSLVIEAINRKTYMPPEERRTRVITNIIDLGEMCRVYPRFGDFEMFSEVYKHYQRNEIEAAHVTIDIALKYIKNIIFALNGIYYPEEKSYYIRYFSNLPIQPPHIEQVIKEILSKERTQNTIASRLNLLRLASRNTISYAKKHVDIPDDIYREIMNN